MQIRSIGIDLGKTTFHLGARELLTYNDLGTISQCDPGNWRIVVIARPHRKRYLPH